MPESKKIVVKVDVHDNKDKRKALKSVSSLEGIESFEMDMKDKKLTVIGDVDPVCIVCKLKKWHPEILTVGPAKAEPKNEEKDGDKKKKQPEEACKKWLECNRPYYPCMPNYPCMPYYPCMPQQYCVRSVEECPNSCVTC